MYVYVHNMTAATAATFTAAAMYRHNASSLITLRVQFNPEIYARSTGESISTGQQPQHYHKNVQCRWYFERSYERTRKIATVQELCSKRTLKDFSGVHGNIRSPFRFFFVFFFFFCLFSCVRLLNICQLTITRWPIARCP